MGESADVEEIEFFSDSEEDAKLSAFGPWQTNAFYSAVYKTVIGNDQSLRV